MSETKCKEQAFKDSYLADILEKDNRGRPFSGKSVTRDSVKPTPSKKLFNITNKKNSFIRTHESLAKVFENNKKSSLNHDKKLSHCRTVINLIPIEGKNMRASQEPKLLTEMLHLSHRKLIKPAASLSTIPTLQKPILKTNLGNSGPDIEQTLKTMKAARNSSKFERRRNRYLKKLKTPKDIDMKTTLISFDAYKSRVALGKADLVQDHQAVVKTEPDIIEEREAQHSQRMFQTERGDVVEKTSDLRVRESNGAASSAL